MTRHTTLFAISIACICGALEAQDPGTNERDLTARARDLLAVGVEEAAAARYWLALGEEVLPVLHGLARDHELPALHRHRAADAIGHFDSRSARDLLLDLAAGADQGLRVAALHGLARLDPSEALAPLDTALADEDAFLRRIAARVLALIPLLHAGDSLEAALTREEDAIVRAEIERAVETNRRHVARLVTDSLLVSFERADANGERRWRVTIENPLDQCVLLELRTQLLTEDVDTRPAPASLATLELSPGAHAILEVPHAAATPGADRGHALLLHIPGEPASTRSVTMVAGD